MEYKEFGEIIKTMDKMHYNYRNCVENKLEVLKERKIGKSFSISEHISAMVFSLLSSNRPRRGIAENRNGIIKLFHNFDVEYIKNTDYNVFLEGLLEIKCGNRQIRAQMQTLRTNIETLERIERDYGSIDEYFNKTDTRKLLKSLSSSNSKYKLKQMSVALVSEYLKNVGIDIIKPDVHVLRILTRLGYSNSEKITENEAFEICDKIAKEYNMTKVEVDTILWQYCADGYCQICSNKPRCSECLVKNCKSRQAK